MPTPKYVLLTPKPIKLIPVQNYLTATMKSNYLVSEREVGILGTCTFFSKGSIF